ncbi:hypothetical protein MUB24_03295 [Lederbergia sp. NSJ-179]|uniref:DUF7667 family protein n=1 Tax=Lederbergia sp. NSJ-179 TaxID=2931402 RepID=UPI001FD57469|nr:hypothetical protein [Lederbergia sp. NSJ-179]MCJ7839952.1 hypothetical protein [Lederbergia sp. NSJ-179]
MNLVAERFIELSVLQKHRRLTRSEKQDLNIALKHLEKLEWRKAKLKNLSLVASISNDVDWQHEICAKLEKLN